MTEVSLKDHLDTRIEWLQRLLETRLDAGDEAVRQAAAKLDVRLEHANNLASTTMEWMRETREEMVQQAEYRALVARVSRLEKAQNESSGRRLGIEPLAAILMVVFAAVVAAVVSKLV